MGIIYHLFNIINGECYIGQTWGSLKKRWKIHCTPKSGCIKLRNAIQYYGKDAFVRSVLTKDLTTQEDMDAAEIYWIQYFNSIKNGYNLTEGGSNGKHLEKTKAKISYAKTGIPFTDKHCAAMSAAHKGIPLSNETRARMSAARMGEKNHMFGKNHTDEARAKQSASHTGHPLSEDHCSALSAARKGVPKSDKHRAAISSANKGEKHYNFSKHLTDEWRAKLKAVNTGKKRPDLKGKKQSPEHIAKRVATKKAKRDKKALQE